MWDFKTCKSSNRPLYFLISFIKHCLQIWSSNFFRNKTHFSEIVEDKANEIRKIAEFLDISKFNENLVIEQTSLQATKEKREKKYTAAGRTFFEGVCYREGKTDSWRNILNTETLKVNETFLRSDRTE